MQSRPALQPSVQVSCFEDLERSEADSAGPDILLVVPWDRNKFPDREASYEEIPCPSHGPVIQVQRPGSHQVPVACSRFSCNWTTTVEKLAILTGFLHPRALAEKRSCRLCSSLKFRQQTSLSLPG